MSVWINKVGTGDGFYFDIWPSGVYNRYIWYGHSFWPSYENQGFDGSATYTYDTLHLYNASTSYNLTDFQVGHEVILYLLEFRYDVSFYGALYMKFVDDEGTVLFLADYSGTYTTSGATNGCYSWIATGVRPQPFPEIWKNGTYYAITSGFVSNTTAFTIFGLDETRLTRYPGKEGTMWVEGNYLWYISAIGCKHFILPEPGGETSTASPGAVWISSGDYRIHWCDSTGIHRKSKLGDKYWTESWDGGDHYVGTSRTGYAFARSYLGWTELQYVAHDGYLVRHGPGYVHTGDYQ